MLGRVGSSRWSVECETADCNIIVASARRRRPRKQEPYAAADRVRSVTASSFVYLCFAFATIKPIMLLYGIIFPILCLSCVIMAATIGNSPFYSGAIWPIWGWHGVVYNIIGLAVNRYLG